MKKDTIRTRAQSQVERSKEMPIHQYAWTRVWNSVELFLGVPALDLNLNPRMYGVSQNLSLYLDILLHMLQSRSHLEHGH